MATQVQFRGGTTVEHSTFTGAAREITIDTDKDTVVVHDGTTAGGYPLATEDGATLTNVDINSGTIDGTTIGATTPSTVSATDLTATGTTTLAGADTSADITFGDNVKATFGIGSDLQIYHDGTHSFIRDAGTGNLRIMASNLRIGNAAETQNYILANDGAAVTLNYNGSSKLATTSTGVDITGTVTMDGATTSGDINFGDNDKAIFGAGSDLQIYHDGSNSYVWDAGAGNLILVSDGSGVEFKKNNGEYLASFSNDGPATLYYDNASKLATTSDGVTLPSKSDDTALSGTSNSHGLHMYQRAFGIAQIDSLVSGTSNSGMSLRTYNNGTYTPFIQNIQGNTTTFATAGSERMRIDSSGNVGIGTSSTAANLHVYENTTNGTINNLALLDAGNQNPSVSGSGVSLDFRSNSGISYFGGVGGYSDGTNYVAGLWGGAAASGAPDLAVTSSGNVGIGTTSPAQLLHVNSTGNVAAAQIQGASHTVKLSTDGAGAILGTTTNGYMLFSTNSAERMRIDTSGNLLVGTTDTTLYNNTSGDGLCYRSGASLDVTAASDNCLILNRNTTDGGIAEFRKDGTIVGTIGSRIGNLYTTYTSNGYGLTGTSTSNAVIPSLNGSTSDNAVDLGAAGVRFDDIYATNGTIQTSDQNEKQDIEALSDAEQRVAVAAKGLLRKFRWRDAVEEKGDEARTHFGIIAQDLQAAFAAEGLDAGDYAMFIHTTWTDEETGEERSRMGVRYSELLAFIIAAI